MRTPVFVVSNQVRHKPGIASTRTGLRLEISDLNNREIVLFRQHNAKSN